MDALDLLAQDNYIIVNKTLVKEIGLENAIVLGVLCGYQRTLGNDFYKEQEKIIDDTGLTEYLVRKSIRELQELGFIDVIKKGMPCKYYYSINLLKFKFLSSSGAKIDTTSGADFDTTCANENDTTNNKNNNNKNKTNKNNKELEEIFNFWNEQDIINHNSLTDDMKKLLNTRLNEYDVEQLKECISHYSEAYHSDYEYCKYKWNLQTFFKQKNAYLEFMEDGSKWINYLKWKEENDMYYQSTDSITIEEL